MEGQLNERNNIKKVFDKLEKMEKFGKDWLVKGDGIEDTDTKKDEEAMQTEIMKLMKPTESGERPSSIPVLQNIEKIRTRRQEKVQKLKQKYAQQVIQITKQLVLIREEYFGSLHPSTLLARHLLAHIYQRLQMVDQAEELVVENLTFWQTLKQRCDDPANLPSHPITHSTLNTIVLLSEKLRLKEKRRKRLERVGDDPLASRSEEEEEEVSHPSFRRPFTHPSNTVRENFERLTKEEIDRIELAMTKKHVMEMFDTWHYFSVSSKLYSDLLMQKGLKEEAKKLLEKTLQKLKENKQDHSFNFLLILRTLAEVYHLTGEFEKAEASYDYLMQFSHNVEYPSILELDDMTIHPTIEQVKIMADAAMNKTYMEKYEEAVVIIDRVVALLDQEFGKCSVMAVEIQINFLPIFLTMGDGEGYERRLTQLANDAKVAENQFLDMIEEEGATEEESIQLSNRYINVLRLQHEFYTETSPQPQKALDVLEDMIEELDEKKELPEYIDEHHLRLFDLLDLYHQVNEYDKPLSLIEKNVFHYKMVFGDPSLPYLEILSSKVGFMYAKSFHIPEAREEAASHNEDRFSQSKLFLHRLSSHLSSSPSLPSHLMKKKLMDVNKRTKPTADANVKGGDSNANTKSATIGLLDHLYYNSTNKPSTGDNEGEDNNGSDVIDSLSLARFDIYRDINTINLHLLQSKHLLLPHSLSPSSSSSSSSSSHRPHLDQSRVELGEEQKIFEGIEIKELPPSPSPSSDIIHNSPPTTTMAISEERREEERRDLELARLRKEMEVMFRSVVFHHHKMDDLSAIDIRKQLNHIKRGCLEVINVYKRLMVEPSFISPSSPSSSSSSSPDEVEDEAKERERIEKQKMSATQVAVQTMVNLSTILTHLEEYQEAKEMCKQAIKLMIPDVKDSFYTFLSFPSSFSLNDHSLLISSIQTLIHIFQREFKPSVVMYLYEVATKALHIDQLPPPVTDFDFRSALAPSTEKEENFLHFAKENKEELKAFEEMANKQGIYNPYSKLPYYVAIRDTIYKDIEALDAQLDRLTLLQTILSDEMKYLTDINQYNSSLPNTQPDEEEEGGEGDRHGDNKSTESGDLDSAVVKPRKIVIKKLRLKTVDKIQKAIIKQKEELQQRSMVDIDKLQTLETTIQSLDIPTSYVDLRKKASNPPPSTAFAIPKISSSKPKSILTKPKKKTAQ